MPIRNRNQKCRSSEFLFKIATKTKNFENFGNHNQKSIRNQSVSHILDQGTFLLQATLLATLQLCRLKISYQRKQLLWRSTKSVTVLKTPEPSASTAGHQTGLRFSSTGLPRTTPHSLFVRSNGAGPTNWSWRRSRQGKFATGQGRGDINTWRSLSISTASWTCKCA